MIVSDDEFDFYLAVNFIIYLAAQMCKIKHF